MMINIQWIELPLAVIGAIALVGLICMALDI
jgi:hypothetical protein